MPQSRSITLNHAPITLAILGVFMYSQLQPCMFSLLLGMGSTLQYVQCTFLMSQLSNSNGMHIPLHAQSSTLPETNDHQKMDGCNARFLLGWPIFRGYVFSFKDISEIAKLQGWSLL